MQTLCSRPIAHMQIECNICCHCNLTIYFEKTYVNSLINSTHFTISHYRVKQPATPWFVPSQKKVSSLSKTAEDVFFSPERKKKTQIDTTILMLQIAHKMLTFIKLLTNSEMGE